MQGQGMPKLGLRKCFNPLLNETDMKAYICRQQQKIMLWKCRDNLVVNDRVNDV